MKNRYQANQKILTYLKDFINSDYFKDQVVIIRSKFNIPPNGFIIKNEESIKSPYLFYLPTGMTIEQAKGCRIEMKARIVDKFPISGRNLNHAFFIFILYNVLRMEFFEEDY